MEREDRAPVGTFYAPGAWARADSVELAESAAHHAMVKRLSVGDPVLLTNGAGTRARACIAELSRKRLLAAIDDAPVDDVRVPPRIDLWIPIGDRDRMLWLAEKSVELGVSSWRAVAYARSRSVSPRGEGAAFQEKLRLRMVGALEQSGGAWLPELRPEATMEDALRVDDRTIAGSSILLDRVGDALGELLPTLDAPVRVALGPEGGLEEGERAAFMRAGWRLVSIGANVLRFETAGIAALAILRSHPRS